MTLNLRLKPPAEGAIRPVQCKLKSFQMEVVCRYCFHRSARVEMCDPLWHWVLREALPLEIKKRALDVASRMELHGARIAAERLMQEFGQ